MSVSGGSVTEATISSLMSSTTYSIQVAAVNSAGTGVYSELLNVQTESKCPYHLYFVYVCTLRICLTYYTLLQVYTSV